MPLHYQIDRGLADQARETSSRLPFAGIPWFLGLAFHCCKETSGTDEFAQSQAPGMLTIHPQPIERFLQLQHRAPFLAYPGMEPCVP